MFEIGLLIGIYGYALFLLGLLGFFYHPVLWLFSILFTTGSIFYWKKRNSKGENIWGKIITNISFVKKDKISLFLLALLIAQSIVNVLGALGPELGFDALWYHLTLPKIYLLSHGVIFIPGGLLYYSAMPKFIELLYTGGLAFGSEVFPKLIHFGFGILTLVALYKISRKFFSQRLSLFILVLFYANLVVGWESISAYIDLGRTFFELLSFWAFLEWIEKRERRWFYYSAIFIGLAITTKLLAVESFVILVLLIAVVQRKRKHNVFIIKTLITYTCIAFLVPFPWIIFSIIHTGTPLYPFFTHMYPIRFPLQLLNPFQTMQDIWNLFLFSADPLNPFYLITIPLVVLSFRKWAASLKLIGIYAFCGIFFWYITPRTGGGRFILPYLPFFSIISGIGISLGESKKLKQLLFLIGIVIAISSVGYRAIANMKFLPVIVHQETQEQFLSAHLNFTFGDFADIDGYFKKHIKPTDTVLLYGFHNLYYVDFPFIDSSWVQKGDTFTYIATQNAVLPKRFANWNLLYTNTKTHVSLYAAGGVPWTY